ncbi:COP9 signalosome complex subunit 7 [Castilleja foliolosa]|uniref:COP9 signalosome complex subunit 7 n=1 Tax=Castilleja foliolosa TaxID=1961234 RepID=A0ABD3C4M0_9LAMI
MDIEEKQAEHIEYFVKQASSLSGAALANVVVEATSHPFLFAFSEILAVSNVLELEGTENSIFLDLLRMFSYGTWSEYKSDASRLPQLVPDQLLKLKQLTVLTLAETNKVLPYDMLMHELDVSNVRELEDFLINDCMYVGILRGKLDQLQRCFEVQFAAGRDLRPSQLGSMIQVLANWLTTSDDLLVSIQEKIKWADSMAEMDKKHKKEMDERVEDAKKTLSLKVNVTNCEQAADNDFGGHEEIFSLHGGVMDHDQDRIRPKSGDDIPEVEEIELKGGS